MAGDDRPDDDRPDDDRPHDDRPHDDRPHDDRPHDDRPGDVPHWAGLLRVGDEERRVLGFPRDRLLAEGGVSLAPVRHPVRWLRWWRQVRRLGPYAPDFDPGRRRPPRR